MSNKICAISDLHGELIDLEPCDICAIPGDIVPCKMQRNYPQSASWFKKKFFKWTANYPDTYFVITPGNHDFWLYDLYMRNAIKDEIELPDNVHLLIDESIEINGVTVFGTPWVTGLPDWAFNLPKDKAFEHFNKVIPNSCDIVITHAAPAIGDLGVVLETGYNYLNNFSEVPLANAYLYKHIKYAFNGHIHSGRHENIEVGGTIYRNVSLMNEQYQPVYRPYYFEL